MFAAPGELLRLLLRDFSFLFFIELPDGFLALVFPSGLLGALTER
jgi:hypothetical protein